MPQVEIWALPGAPLKESDWLNYGYDSLADYVTKEKNGHKDHRKEACGKCLKLSNEPLVSFGNLDAKTGFKTVKKVCQTVDDLPTEDIDGVLIFNK